MIALTDKQVEHILSVARPLPPPERRLFAAALLEALLNRRDELGDGALGRLLQELQRRHFTPPTETETEWHSNTSRKGAQPRAFERRA